MPGLPEVTVTGTIVADPELKFFDSGVCVANFTIAANDRRFDREQNKWVDASATFLNCQVWRQPAENVVQSLTKGARVIATGQLKQRSYENANGEKRTVFDLVVTEIGPSLKFATATVHKAARANGRPADDNRWTSAPPEPAAAPPRSSGYAEEPPF